MHFTFTKNCLREKVWKFLQAYSHCLSRYLDGKKNYLLLIYPSNFHKGFFRKSPFCTFSFINPWFVGPCDKLWIFFLIAIFIMLLAKKNLNFMHRFKSAILAKLKNCHLLSTVHTDKSKVKILQNLWPSPNIWTLAYFILFVRNFQN